MNATPPVAATPASELRTPPEPVAVIDVGSNSIRMCVAEISAEGRVRELVSLTQPVRLGVDTFRRGRIGGEALRAACTALFGFRRVMEDYGVRRYRAVGTSAVREAANCDAFLDRVQVTTGLKLENVEGIEESRLTYQMVRALVGRGHGLPTDHSMILSLGSGSAEITVLEAGRVVFSETRRVGTLRLLEMLDLHSEKATRRLLGVFLADVAASVKRLHPDLHLERFFVISSDLHRVAGHLEPSGEAGSAVGGRRSDRTITVIPRKRFDDFRTALFRADPAERAERYGLSLEDGETLLPAVMAVQSFWGVTQAAEAVLLDVSMLDSLLLDFSLRRMRGDWPAETADAPAAPAAPVTPLPAGEPRLVGAAAAGADPEDDFHAQVVSSAIGLGRRYHFDEPHARHVHMLALQLFDQTRGLHGLVAGARLLLEVSAILHDIGLYVGPTSHHKHSMYLIKSSELMGLTRDDLNRIAIVVRYHRRSPPRPQHPEFAGLPREHQILVSKLASLLRIAEALDRSHAQSVRRVGVELDGSDVLLIADAADDLSLERWSLRSKADFFESLYGCNVRLRVRPSGAENP